MGNAIRFMDMDTTTEVLPIIHGSVIEVVVEVTVEGEINARTGMIIDLSRLKKITWSAALEKLDHTNLDKQHDFFIENPR
jgi:6-pyruvoyltetrahydropterin/6-carboxytetrahydropterin synthase